MARERTLDECFDICLDASASEDEALRTAATSVLVVLASKVEFLELKTYEQLNSRLIQVKTIPLHLLNSHGGPTSKCSEPKIERSGPPIQAHSVFLSGQRLLSRLET